MPKSPQSFLVEAQNAVRGCWELLRGNRSAATYFDFSPSGLVGSLAMVLLLVALTAFAPLPTLADPNQPVAHILPALVVLLNVGAYGVQSGAVYLFLRAIKRTDALLPYLVAGNWVLLVTYAFVLLAAFLGPLGPILSLLIYLAALFATINVARLIATLKPLQIVLLFVTQIVCIFISLVIVLMMFPGLETALSAQ